MLVRPERNGYFYVIDRATGAGAVRRPLRLSSTRTSGVDLKTGRLIPSTGEGAEGRAGSCATSAPAAPGAKDWNPSAFSPRTGLLYIPHNNLCMDMGAPEANYIAGTPYVGADVRMYAGPGRQSRRLHRLGPGARAARCGEIKEDLPVWSGALATAGDLVFYGTMDGWFKAVDARTGELLWQFKTG